MIYSYRCENCGMEFDEHCSMKDRNKIKKCPSCNHGASRNLVAEMTNVDSQHKENHRWSWAMGVNVDQIPEMKKRYPDRTYHERTGQLLVKSRQHKKQLLREHGMIEYN